jgi:hypothetical protein
MRAFVALREFAAGHKAFGGELEQLERKVGEHDGQKRSLFEASHLLMELPAPRSRRMGFKT